MPAQTSRPGSVAKAVTSPYDVTLRLTPEAVKKLSELKDLIQIDGYYYGFPIRTAVSEANPIDQIELGDDNYTFAPTVTKAHMAGLNIDRSRFDDITGREPYILISVSSADPSGFSDELLDCTHFRGTLARAQSGAIEISCTLYSSQSD